MTVHGPAAVCVFLNPAASSRLPATSSHHPSGSTPRPSLTDGQALGSRRFTPSLLLLHVGPPSAIHSCSPLATAPGSALQRQFDCISNHDSCLSIKPASCFRRGWTSTQETCPTGEHTGPSCGSTRWPWQTPTTAMRLNGRADARHTPSYWTYTLLYADLGGIAAADGPSAQALLAVTVTQGRTVCVGESDHDGPHTISLQHQVEY